MKTTMQQSSFAIQITTQFEHYEVKKKGTKKTNNGAYSTALICIFAMLCVQIVVSLDDFRMQIFVFDFRTFDTDVFDTYLCMQIFRNIRIFEKN